MSIGEERYGIECPECGDPLSNVVDTTPALGRIRRRRECLSGHRVTTVEFIAGDIDGVLEAADTVRASVDALVSAMLRASPVIDKRFSRRARESEAA